MTEPMPKILLAEDDSDAAAEGGGPDNQDQRPAEGRRANETGHTVNSV